MLPVFFPTKDLKRLGLFLLSKKFISGFLILAFTLNTFISPVFGFDIPAMVQQSMMQVYYPLTIKGVSFDPFNPFTFNFLLDTGSTKRQGIGFRVSGIEKEHTIEEEAHNLMEYFLLGLTLPEDDIWVNLSAYEKDKILPESIDKTIIGTLDRWFKSSDFCR